MSVDWSSLSEGEERHFEVADVNRTHFVRYAGASGDFNPIHHDQTFAEAAGLPTVFGIGMWTAGVYVSTARVPQAQDPDLGQCHRHGLYILVRSGVFGKYFAT